MRPGSTPSNAMSTLFGKEFRGDVERIADIPLLEVSGKATSLRALRGRPLLLLFLRWLG